mmetsp:Transcript_3101/g.9465  ORF Transcript_3101/g.9465 Transcript_3101/m.9465 type:complete len:747 (+) Transcript_3101:443-2683(+)|eukprot:CAMPEP_0198732718 /NCGR_PEP_ID=MMETSP1475-20131203/38592_1 /TAXON_ID= ORGANISM="Unidentified sp., Strain CCMP1999" /NCGR_SAMPLE_ID=MMETSP1475 /ASSEMBLY_ACC=CAM_ASM_001111 /LENGTH=746 /DNA_ID=CAMNT_0044495873 /DNA_START=280 /DNA_END=2520 /DNA_ORIENTATION=-
MADAEEVNTEGYEGVEYVVLNDDVLTSVYNASSVLVEGSDLERLAVLFQFPQFLEHCPGDTINVMVPEICKNAVDWSDNATMAAAEALYFVVGVVLPPAISRQVVEAALRIVGKMGQGDIFDAWGEILSMIIPQVTREDVLNLLVPITLERCASSTVESRRLAARIMGSLTESLTEKELEDMFLAKSIALCDDADSSVRAMIAQSLATMGAKLPLRISEKHYWAKLFNLTKDQNARVRAASVRAVAKSAEAHKDEALKSKSFSSLLLPMFIEKCRDATTTAASDLRTVDDDTYLMLEIFAEVYGYFLVAMTPLFPDEEMWTTALNALRRMVTCNGPTVRHWCAFNLPAVATTCGIKRPDRIKGVLQALSTDTDVETRATLAAGIHETTKILADGELREELLSAINELMTDQNPQVRMNALTHFAEVLEMLSKKDSAAKHLSNVFTNLDILSQDSWRTQKVLAEQLDKAACLIPQETLCESVAPILFQMARESTYLVRNTAIAAIVRVLRYIPTTRRRDHILTHFIKEWAQGKVYWTRLAYLDGADSAHKIFSRGLYKKLFVEEGLKMYKDTVPNVRLRLVKMMINITGSCKDMPLYKEALDGLLNDEDQQVRELAVQCKQGISQFKGFTREEDEVDRQREEAEKKFFIYPKSQAKDGRGNGVKLDGQKPSGNKSFTNGPPPFKPPLPSDVVPSKFTQEEEAANEQAEAQQKNEGANGVVANQQKQRTSEGGAQKPGARKSVCCTVQ